MFFEILKMLRVVTTGAKARQTRPRPAFANRPELGATASPNLLIPLISGQFPSIRGLNLAGRADSGLRFYLRFSPVPATMKLFVPVIAGLTMN